MIKRPTRKENLPEIITPPPRIGAKSHHGGAGGGLYREEFVYWGYRLALLGASDHEMAAAFGVTSSRIPFWIKEHPDFGQAIREGRELADSLVAHALYQKACGYTRTVKKAMLQDGKQIILAYEEHIPPDTTAAIYWLKVRRPDLWREQPVVPKRQDVTPEMIITDPYTAFRALKDAT